MFDKKKWWTKRIIAYAIFLIVVGLIVHSLKEDGIINIGIVIMFGGLSLLYVPYLILKSYRRELARRYWAKMKRQRMESRMTLQQLKTARRELFDEFEQGSITEEELERALDAIDHVALEDGVVADWYDF